jgi:hypothetical protein
MGGQMEAEQSGLDDVLSGWRAKGEGRRFDAKVAKPRRGYGLKASR